MIFIERNRINFSNLARFIKKLCSNKYLTECNIFLTKEVAIQTIQNFSLVNIWECAFLVQGGQETWNNMEFDNLGKK